MDLDGKDDSLQLGRYKLIFHRFSSCELSCAFLELHRSIESRLITQMVVDMQEVA